jgi:ubiquinone/menaquinone biosynthesis C-methylase UbiE/DNA-binding transcriptional ArsR family regulator
METLFPKGVAMNGLASRSMVSILKAAAEPTRLRILALLAAGELNVKDLTRILGQSQPRISRHLKLMTESGLIERAPEGSWVYFHLADDPAVRRFARQLLDNISVADEILARDRQRADAVKREHENLAQTYFQSHAPEWDRIRALHVAEADVEAAMQAALGAGPFELLVDLGTGTGRMLELFAARYQRGLGLDLNATMLAYARAKLAKAGIAHAQVRQGDIYSLPIPDRSAAAVVMHQILHFLSDPARALSEAARVLAPGGRLLIVDFAPHELEFLREAYAHERLGFAPPSVSLWLSECGLDVLEFKELAPPREAAAEKLTVSLWLAGRRLPERLQNDEPKRKLERVV